MEDGDLIFLGQVGEGDYIGLGNLETSISFEGGRAEPMKRHECKSGEIREGGCRGRRGGYSSLCVSQFMKIVTLSIRSSKCIIYSLVL